MVLVELQAEDTNAVLVRCDAGRRFGVVAVDIDGKTIASWISVTPAALHASTSLSLILREALAMSIMFSPTPLQNSFCA